jgi:hypothetical protein
METRREVRVIVGHDSVKAAKRRAGARNHVHRFSVDVAENHEAMNRGQVSRTVFIAVLADDAVEASLLAAQMASRHGIATSVRPLIT